MNVKEALGAVRERLADAGIEEHGLESELLVRYLLCVDSVTLFLEHDEKLTSAQIQLLNDLVERRLKGEPLAYITGKREFYGLEFMVNSSVLIPRPETEHLVEKTIELASKISRPTIADIGTGSGAIAVSLAAGLPQAKIYAVDISDAALDTARFNARRHAVEARITFLYGDLTAPLPEPVDILITNLPYVKSADCATSPEPHLALDGGAEGLDVIERLCDGLKSKLKPGASVLLEIGIGQAQAVKKRLQSALPAAKIETIKDLAGIERVVWGKLREMGGF
jgi:release factor glutamine methyltransferase